jgi:ketosteroid isomerase-like protein
MLSLKLGTAQDGVEMQRRDTAPGSLDDEVRRWLLAMQESVRDADFEAARELFSPEVFSFGTVAATADGLGTLERDQWRAVWPHTREFSFDLDEARTLAFRESACVAVPWRSQGVRSDGSTFARRGRASLLLVRSGDRLVAAHSHFSMWPLSGE